MSAFRLIFRENIQELNGALAIYEHKKTGAKLVHVDVDDEQKLFAIGFRTMPFSDCGVAHILEHSVLNGSKHYPVKEPFVELMKGSLNTFLNAMTNSDWTAYPVMSPNLKDFYNLMDVYLDAVMNPLLYCQREILMQEGWHYELNDADELVINGVVYNEMKGAMSDTNTQLFCALEKELYTNFYTFNSGGDPAAIPTLTQERFVAFHREFYHPSNSFTVISGRLDIEPVLEHIDANYFSRYDRREALHLPLQERMSAPKEKTVEYAVPEGQDAANMTYLAIGSLTYKDYSREESIALSILSSILFGSEAAPVKRAILDEGIGRDAEGAANDQKEGEFAITVTGAQPGDMERLKAVLDTTLRRIVREGLDEKLIEGAINKYEFNCREMANAGIMSRIYRAMELLGAWNNDNDISDAVRYEEAISSIRKKAKDGYFTQLIEKYLIDNPHTVRITMVPSPGLAERSDAMERERLAKLKASMSKEELQSIRTAAEKLKTYQHTPDTAEALASMPRLTLEDVGKDAGWFDLERIEDGFMFRREFTAGVTNVDLMFDMSALDAEETKYAALLGALIGKLPTAKRGYEALAIETDIETGGIATGCGAMRKKAGGIYPFMNVSMRCLTSKLFSALSLLDETVLLSDYTAHERLAQTAAQLYTGLQSDMQNAAAENTTIRCRSYFMEDARFLDDTNGFNRFAFMGLVMRELKDDASKVSAKLANVAEKLFTRANLTLLLTGDDAELAAFRQNLPVLTENIPAGEKRVAAHPFEENIKNEGIMSASRVQYVCEAYDYKKLGFAYNGSALALNNFMRSGYMWQKIRVQGGAYGCRLTVGDDGVLDLSSYRDPKLAETLDVYGKISEYLRTAEIEEDDVKNSIISAVSRLDSPVPPRARAMRAFEAYITGKTREEKQRERDELLASTVKDIRAFAPLFDAVIARNCICVYGNAEKLRENKERFKSLITVE